MIHSRAFTLLGLTLFFSATSLALFLSPPLIPYVFPSFCLVFLWMDLTEEFEIGLVFAFLIFMVGMIQFRYVPTGALKIAIAAHYVGMLAFFYFGLTYIRRKLGRERYRLQLEMTDLVEVSGERHRAINFYERHKENINSQIRLRREFVEAAQTLGRTMDLLEVKERLLEILSRKFPEPRIELVSGAPKDHLEMWAAQQRLPVLVGDVKADERFKGFRMNYPFRSIMVIPIRVLQQPVGFVRLEHERPHTFQVPDLRAAELFTTLAALSMENVRIYEHIQEMAITDGLTQLYTHRYFQTRMADEILTAGRTKAPVSLIMTDIDFFKEYNDTFGHQSGDLLLRSIAGILRSGVRDVDFVARYGGEEFAIILPSVGKWKAAQLAEAIRQRVERERFFFAGRPSRVTLSFGVASFPEDATTQSQLIRFADERLYKAKQGGRNHVVS